MAGSERSRRSVDYLNRRFHELETLRSEFIPLYENLAMFINPRMGRFNITDDDRSHEKYDFDIIDNRAKMALRTLSSGMMAGITSPTRPWFRLAAPDPDLNKFQPVRVWTAEVAKRMLQVFQKSNVYNMLPIAYKELGLFGTGALFVREDIKTTIRAFNFTAGSYMIAQNDDQVVDTIYREYRMTADQIVRRWGKENIDDDEILRAFQNKPDEKFEIIHAIEPNFDRIRGMRNNTNMPYISFWYRKSASKKNMLHVAGFNEFPVMCPRWDLNGEDVYGSSPGMDCLGDTKQLEADQVRKGQNVDKITNPPLAAPESLKTKKVSQIPGDITYYNTQTGGVRVEPLVKTEPTAISTIIEDIQDIRTRIDTAFYVDLFLQLSNTDRRMITAREVEERHSEKLLMLGPVLERLQDELLEPLIDRTFGIMQRNGDLPTPPDELDGVDLGIEYISILAQAQKSVGTQGIVETFGFVTQVAQVYPEATDKIDSDKMIDEFSEMTGVPPSIMAADDAVEGKRSDRAQQQAQQQALMSGMMASEAAKNLGQASTEEGTALGDTVEQTRSATRQ